MGVCVSVSKILPVGVPILRDIEDINERGENKVC